MTTNAGASDMARESIGFGQATREDVQEEAVKNLFTPEFRNRLDAIVPFGYLPPEVVARVVDKFILQLELRSEEHTSELQSLMRNSYAVFCLIKKREIEAISSP